MLPPSLKPSQRNKHLNNKNYYISMVNSKTGKRTWRSLNTTKLSEAMTYCENANSNRFAPKEEKEERVIVNIATMVEKFFKVMKIERHRNPGTVKHYITVLNEFTQHFEKYNINMLELITPLAASDYITNKLSGNAESTLKNKLVIIRHFINWAIDHFSLNIKNPFDKIKGPKNKQKVHEFWTFQQCEAIIKAAENLEEAVFFALQAFAGLRVSEAQYLKLSDIDDNMILVHGKGDKISRLFIFDKLHEILVRWLALRSDTYSEFLLPCLAVLKNPPTSRLIKAIRRANLESAGRVFFHRFRHSFASNLVRAGAHIKAVQTLMRHENVAITLDKYSHLAPSDERAALRLLGTV